MNNLIPKAFQILVFTFLFVSVNFCQTATATATATIVSPIGATKTVDMNFGNVAVSGAGTVILTPEGNRTTTGDVNLPATTGTIAAAAFNVTGENNFTYSITLPQNDYVITRDGGSETMTVNSFISIPGVESGGRLNTGSQTLTVGATLIVSENQEPGVYSNPTGFEITVNYN